MSEGWGGGLEGVLSGTFLSDDFPATTKVEPKTKKRTVTLNKFELDARDYKLLMDLLEFAACTSSKKLESQVWWNKRSSKRAQKLFELFLT